MNHCIDRDGYRLDREYIVGENRPIGLRVSDRNNDSFVITEALYRVIDKNRTVITEGNCDIDNEEHTVMFYFHPSTEGTYTIKFKVTVPPVIRKLYLTAKVKEDGDG